MRERLLIDVFLEPLKLCYREIMLDETYHHPILETRIYKSINYENLHLTVCAPHIPHI